MSEDRFTELAADYVLGLLEGDELLEFERHLAAGCRACETEVSAMDTMGDALAYSGPPVRPPAALRDRLMRAVESDLAEERQRAAAQARLKAAALAPAARPVTTPLSPITPAPAPAAGAVPAPRPPTAREDRGRGVFGFLDRLMPALALAGLLAAVLSGAYSLRLRDSVAALQADLERVTGEKNEMARVLDVVESTRLQVIALGGLKPSPGSTGRVLWSPDTKKALFYAYDLPQPPAGKDYQLWVIEGQTPKSEGVFPVDERGHAMHVLPEVPDPAAVGAFAVTLEPAGGVPQPTGDMFLLGTVPTKLN